MSAFSFASVRRALVPAVALVLLAVAAASAEKVNRARSGLALEGYDVVAYFTENMPVKGNRQFAYEHDGTTYLFASAANRDLFAKEPAKYLPQYGGFCAWAVSRGYTANVDPQAWRIVDGRLFLNYSLKVRDMWSQDVPGNIQKGDANWPALSRK